MAETSPRRDVPKATAYMFIDTIEDADTEIPDECPVCTSNELSWALTSIKLNSIPDGQLCMHDVMPVLMLACDWCAETVALVRHDHVIHYLVTGEEPKTP